jgi:murein DD-endopeptidase MepM/ murein hydrolase activator NlpD
MRISVPFARHGSATAKFVFTAVAAALLAGCSGSIERFSSSSGNPSDSDPVYTASVPKFKKRASRSYAAPVALASEEETIVQSPIASAPVYRSKKPVYDYTQSYKKPFKQAKLAQDEIPAAPVYEQPKRAQNTAPAAPAYKKPVYNAPVIDEQDVADEPVLPAAPVYKKPMMTAQAPAAVSSKKSGATVQVNEGMTMYSIARANGVTVPQLAEANGIAAPYTVSKGQVLRIPGRSTAQLPVSEETPAPKVVSLVEEEQSQKPTFKLKAKGAHVVATGDTLFSIGRKYGVSPFAIADLNKLPRDKALSVGQELSIPASGRSPVVAQKEITEPVKDQEAIADSEAPVPDDQKVAATKPKRLTLPKEEPAPKQVAEIPADAGPGLSMRWPVKGKVISEYGAKPNGLKNEGINIAVPEGTSVRAAESGVVAYAGNELKGYGNLVLIRHAGGYVTAYAHASQLMVKRGDTVKRGDVIAKAGQTGAVQSPQLHFEVRKGASALDPNKYLSSSTAMR